MCSVWRSISVLTPEATIKRFTKIRGGERVLRRKKDTIFDNVCQFLDTDTRRCGIYHARPKVCRTFPEGPTLRLLRSVTV
jgi:Fe-S-cluster containining protein